MPVLDQLASALGRRDETPNVELAQRISINSDAAAITGLVELLRHHKPDIRSDAVKVLYEIGERTPALIAPYTEAFLQLLDGKNNRLVWGAMTALDANAAVNQFPMYCEHALPVVSGDFKFDLV